MFHEAIVNYINRPDVFLKLAEKFPQASTGVPSEYSKISSLEEAVYSLARSSYIQRKQAALIHSGLNELEELHNGK